MWHAHCFKKHAFTPKNAILTGSALHVVVEQEQMQPFRDALHSHIAALTCVCRPPESGQSKRSLKRFLFFKGKKARLVVVQLVLTVVQWRRRCGEVGEEKHVWGEDHRDRMAIPGITTLYGGVVPRGPECDRCSAGAAPAVHCDRPVNPRE